MLLKLTTPTIPGEPAKSSTCYVDTRHIIMIVREQFEPVRRSVLDDRAAAMDRLFNGATMLAKMVTDYVPPMNDPVAVQWMLKCKEVASAVSAAYGHAQHAMREDTPRHPPQEVTVVHLGCGTALEHGVMLAKVWVVETPEEIVAAIEGLKPIKDGQYVGRP